MGTLEYAISLNTQALIDSSREVQALNNRIATSMNNTGGAVDGLAAKFTQLAGAITSALAVGEINAFIRDTTEIIDQQSKFADVIGISYEELQKLQQLVGTMGIEADDFNDALVDMTRNLQLAAENAAPEVVSQLAQMGIAINDIKNLSPDKQFESIGKAISGLSTQSEKSTKIAELFGEEYTKLIGIFDKTDKEIEDLKKGFEDMGTVISENTAKDVQEFRKNLAGISGEAKGFANALLAEVLPSLTSLSSEVLNFIRDADKMERLFNGLEVAVTSLAVVMTSRVIASLATYTAGLIASAASTGIMTVATTALTSALTLLGGPVGILALVGTALVALAYKAAMAEETIGDLDKKSQNLTRTFKELSDEQLSSNLDKNISDYNKLSKELDKLNSKLDASKGKELSFGEITDLNNTRVAIKNIKKELEGLSLEQSVLIKTQADREGIKEQADEARGVFASVFEKEPIEINLSDFVDLVGELKTGALTDEEALKAGFEETERLLKAYAEAFPQFADQAKLGISLARNELDKGLKELNDETAKNLEDAKAKLMEAAVPSGADLSSTIARIKNAEAKEIKEIEVIYAKYPELLNERNAAIKEINDRTSREIQDARDADAENEKKYVDFVNSILLDSERSRAGALEKININEREALSELDGIRDEKLISEEQYEQARLATQLKYADLREKNAEAELAKEKALADKKAAEAKRIQEKAQRDQEKAKADKEKQDKANTSFSDFAESFVETTPLEDIANREAEALEKLKELYGESTSDVEEYNKGVNDITARFAKERQDQILADQIAFGESVSQLLGVSSDGFAALADVISKSGEESSTAYKALFAISKGFAVAQASLNFALSLTQALASGPFPANLAAVSATAASGVALVSAVTSATYTGRQNGGPTSPNSTYKVNENSPEVYSYGNSDYLMTGSSGGSVTPLDQYMNGQGGGVNVIINNNAAGVEVSASQGVSENEVIVLIQETVPAEISNPNSKTSKAIKASTTSRRKLT